MTYKKLIVSFVFSAGIALAQLPDLRGFLELSETQTQELTALRQQLAVEVQPLLAPIAADRQRLREELNSEVPDPFTAGDLIIRIDHAEKEIRELQTSRRADFQAVLTPDQAEKLNPLRLSNLLRAASRQAVELNLIGEGEPPTDGETATSP